MLSEDIQEIVMQHFGLSELWLGLQDVIYKRRDVRAFVEYIWVITIKAGEIQPIVLAATRISSWKDNEMPGIYRNMIWLHPPEPKGIRRKVSIKVVELNINEPDPVADALTAMYMIPIHSTAGLDVRQAEYEVFTITQSSHGYFKYRGRPQSPNMRVF